MKKLISNMCSDAALGAIIGGATGGALAAAGLPVFDGADSSIVDGIAVGAAAVAVGWTTLGVICRAGYAVAESVGLSSDASEWVAILLAVSAAAAVAILAGRALCTRAVNVQGAQPRVPNQGQPAYRGNND